MRILRKGLSPLIAAVLLIAFTMAVAAILTAWVSTFTKSQTEKSQVFEEQIDCSYANIENDANFAAYDAVDKMLRVYVTNTGSGIVVLTNLTIWKLGSSTPELSKSLDPNTGLTIEQGKLKILYLNLAAYGEPSRAQITTTCGTKWTTTYRPSTGWKPFDYTATSGPINGPV